MIIMTPSGALPRARWFPFVLARRAIKALFATIVLALTGVVLSTTTAAAAAPANAVSFHYFPETGHNLIGRAKAFYDRNGDQAIFGLPLTQIMCDGRVGSSVGGGICYVSTALYRAAFLAGLEIVERHPHLLALASFNDTPGFDAAVASSGPDLRWRNDTPHPIFVTAELNERGAVVISPWGQGDGRQTTLRGPVVRRGTDVINTTITRVVIAPNGKVLHTDTVRSSYSTYRRRWRGATGTVQTPSAAAPGGLSPAPSPSIEQWRADEHWQLPY